jgi:S1-C subfamily serine protease
MRRAQLFVVLAAGGLAGFSLASFFTGSLFDDYVGPGEATAAPELLPDEKRLAEIFELVSPSVVYISNDAVHRDWFSRDVFRVPQGTGSGFVWDNKGHIVTNNHVIEGADLVSVSFDSKKLYRAHVVGTAPDKDLAVLRVDAPAEFLRPITLGHGDSLRVGMEALAIGNPFGLDHSLTRGIISALDRELMAPNGRVIDGVVQTDAAINPGNSGGPLLNSRGELIGVNTAIVSKSGMNAGIGFAVPVSTVRRVVPQLIEHGRVTRPGLGVYLFSDDVARQWGIRKGVIVRQVVPGSAAERSGLQGARIHRSGEVELGDIIVSVAGREVENMNDLLNELERHQVGDEVEIGVRRGRSEASVRVRLQKVE